MQLNLDFTIPLHREWMPAGMALSWFHEAPDLMK